MRDMKPQKFHTRTGKKEILDIRVRWSKTQFLSDEEINWEAKTTQNFHPNPYPTKTKLGHTILISNLFIHPSHPIQLLLQRARKVNIKRFQQWWHSGTSWRDHFHRLNCCIIFQNSSFTSVIPNCFFLWNPTVCWKNISS